MNPTLYLETTIPSYLVSRPGRNTLVRARQKLTHEWWKTCRKKYEIYVSEVVFEEIELGNPDLATKRIEMIKGFPLLDVTPQVESLGNKLFALLSLPQKSYRDAFHLAIAVYYEINFLLTWNCSHLASGFTRQKLFQFGIGTGLSSQE